jgi:hypothetical protein
MQKFQKLNANALLLAGLAALALVVTPTVASALPGGKNNNKPNVYQCKSGTKVPNGKACKENGGKK